MQFENFEIHAEPVFTQVVCRKCRGNCIEVPNGWLSRAWFCPTCEFVYLLKLVKVAKSAIDGPFLTQCRTIAEAKRKKLKETR